MLILAIGLHKANIPDNIWPTHSYDSNALKKSCEDLTALGMKGEFLFVPSSHSMEIFAVSDDAYLKPRLRTFLLSRLSLKNKQKNINIHQIEGPDAVRHFLQLSLGLESFIENGRNDFLSAVSKSIAVNKELNCAGLVLNRLYQIALMLARKIEQSGLTFDYSFISLQIEALIKKIFGPLQSLRMLIIGQNNLTERILQSIKIASVRASHFLHRSTDTSERLAEKYNGASVNPSEIDSILTGVQVILRMNQDFSESLDAASLQKVMAVRKNHPLLIINLDTTIIPEASLNKVYNLFVYDLNDFQQQRSSSDGIALARELIEKELKEFFSWFYSKERYRFGDIIGKSAAIENILELIARISQTSITVLIQGESGTGKELIARAIHDNSPRRSRSFIVVNCGALPETLLESELFGYVRGAYTSAASGKKGLLEEADGGTLMLDEIGDTSAAFQVKLLRVLQEGEMRRVGSNAVIKIDVRIIAATNKNLDELLAQGRFRKDLYYRLNVVQIDVPPLIRRSEDILPLAEHFIAKYSEEMKKRVIGLSDQAEKIIRSYTWPGNVREIENAIEHAVALCVGQLILPEDLPPHIRHLKPDDRVGDPGPVVQLKDLEKEHIIRALQFYDWDYNLVAGRLGIGRTTLWRKMKEYGINKTSD